MTSDRDRFSLIGHADLPLMNPLREDELLALLRASGLVRGDRVLDLGAGRGDLARIAARELGCVVRAVDRSEAACAVARERTAGLEVEVVCGDARDQGAGSFALACALGAVHAFGERAPGWIAARDALARVASRVLLADLVATGDEAARELEVARVDELAALGAPALVLDAARVSAYERAWSASLARWLDAHPGDPRAEWARARVAWTEAPALRAARAELAFAVFVL